MKSTSLYLLTIASVLAVPAATIAATYNYVDTSGNISAVSANSAAEALTVSNLAPHSGVMLAGSGGLTMTGFVPVTGGASTYAYVDVNGNISSVNANSAAQALTASNIASNSGVMLVR